MCARIYRRTGFLFLFLTTFLSSEGRSIDTFFVQAAQSEYLLEDYLYVLARPKDAQLDLQTIRLPEWQERFVLYRERTLGLDPDSTYWGQIAIDSDEPALRQFQDWLLFTGNANYTTAYFLQGARVDSFLTGDYQRYRDRSILHLQYKDRLPFNVQLDGPLTVVLRLRSDNNKTPSFHGLRLVDRDFYHNWDYIKRTIRDWSFMGLLLAIILLHLAFFLIARDRPFLYHSLFLFGVGIYLLDHFGIMSDLYVIRDFPMLRQFLVYFSLGLIDIAYIQFVRSFFDLRTVLPFWDRLLRWLVVLRLVLLVGLEVFYWYTFDEHFADDFSAYFAGPLYLFMLLFIGYQSLFRRRLYRTGVFLVVGTLFFIVAVLLFSTSFLTFGNNQTVLTRTGLLFVLGEMFIFTTGLGFRFKNLVREKREAQRLKDLNEFQTRLYTNLTHEFRTPLTVIQGMADELSAYLPAGNAKSREAVDLIKRNGDQLLNLVNRLLELARLEAGHLILHYKQGDLVAYLRYLTQSFQSFAANQGVSLQFLTELETLDTSFDEEKLQHILSNLLSNAIKYTPEGGRVSVLVRTEGGQLFLQVKDNGVGIPPEQLPHIFDRFFQGKPSQRVQRPGTGIGLAMTGELLRLMQGSIEVESQPDEGSTFTVILPLVDVADAPAWTGAAGQVEEAPASRHAATGKPLAEPDLNLESGRPIVLIVEDNLDVVRYLQTILAGKYQLAVAYDGESGVVKAQEIVPDLVVSDVMMPGKSGFDLCEALKTHSLTDHIPVILLTARAASEDKLSGLRHGADVYLTKPFAKEELLIRVQNLIELRRTLQARYRQEPASKTGPAVDLADEPEDPFLVQARQVIEGNLSNEDFNVHDFSRALGLSRTQVHRKLQALTGLATTHFITRVRLAQAREMLLVEQDLQIAEIAYRVGFRDPNYFTRRFKEEFGVTPSDLRDGEE